MIDIPVYLVGAAGTPDADNPHCSPCIKCAVTNADGSIHSGEVLGMLDSGAYPNAMEHTLWEKLRLPIVGEDSVHSASSVGGYPICEGLLIAYGVGRIKILAAHFSVMPLRQQGHMYDLILGRKILTLGDFGFSSRHRSWLFALPTED